MSRVFVFKETNKNKAHYKGGKMTDEEKKKSPIKELLEERDRLTYTRDEWSKLSYKEKQIIANRQREITDAILFHRGKGPAPKMAAV